MQQRVMRIHAVLNTPTGTANSLSALFNAKNRAKEQFFHFFPNFLEHFGSKNRIAL